MRSSDYPIRFRVAVRPWKKRRTVLVVIHENVEELRRVANITHPDEDREYADAVCHALPYDTEVRDIVPLIIRFHADGGIYTNIVAHECTHAAAELIWADMASEHPRSAARYLNAGFEPLAYVVGDLTQKIITRAFHLGLVA